MQQCILRMQQCVYMYAAMSLCSNLQHYSIQYVRAMQLWQDYQLKWDPTDYGGINVIRLLALKVWKPDIVLFNK